MAAGALAMRLRVSPGSFGSSWAEEGYKKGEESAQAGKLAFPAELLIQKRDIESLTDAV